MALKGQLIGRKRAYLPPVVSHQDNPEVLLIRVTQWLFKQWKQSLKNQKYAEAKAYDAAFYAVAEAKREYRRPIKEAVQKNREAFAARQRPLKRVSI